MALTNSPILYNNLRQYSSHGITSDNKQMEKRKSSQIWNYQQIKIGYNYRMSDIAASLGLSQLNEVDNFYLSRMSLMCKWPELLIRFGGHSNDLLELFLFLYLFSLSSKFHLRFFHIINQN